MLSTRHYFLTTQIPDITADVSRFIPCPDGGDVVSIVASIETTIVGNFTITAEIGGVAITNGAVTFTAVGSGAGDVEIATPTAAQTVADNGTVELDFDGVPSTAVSVVVTIVILR